MRNLFLLLTALISSSLWAETVTLEKVKTFPVAQEMTYEDGQPATVIETANIFDEEGKVARGPHTINFTLDGASSYAVMVNGQRVEPGETFTFVQNLTTSGHKLILPIYPADGGIEGVVNYALNIPDVKSMVCLPGQQELEDGCLTVTYDVLAINCSPEYVSDTSDGIRCVNYSTAPITLYCDDGYEKNGENCTRVTVQAAPYNCSAYPGSSLEGVMCVQQESHPVSKCGEGWDDVSGQCRGTATSYSATYGCKKGSWNGSECERTIRDSYYYLRTNCQSKIEGNDGSCYDYYVPSCRDGYTYDTYHEQCYKDGETSAPYTHYEGDCNSGDFLKSDFCLVTSSKSEKVPYCTRGTYNSAEHVCEYQSYSDKEYYCPSGGSVSGSSCLTYNFEPYGNYCLDGGDFNPSTGNCETDINEPAGRHCDEPFLMEEDGESCKLTEEYLFKHCDDETFSPSADYSTCERTLTEDPVLECPAGYEVDEKGVQCVKKEETPFIG
ncbi:hypothetical protein [Alteromonas gilva]|uniref:Uncharacterized protein n=1 Tax=Alteromonas gilva TaxID=2987522 RepID=A0ABT5L8N3_9ALTE|nr:hypothetical protein [Alteromonas gilva]MDC8832961.1 hypothetical protein [Alteromonas gilva]